MTEVHAAGGGALRTTTVDLSNTYLDWTRANLELNGLWSSKHRLEREDCRTWLERAAQGTERYDLVFLDPPTFSNSKRMEGTFEVQRDHVSLIEATTKVLARKGTLVFSTNHRKFRLDAPALAALGLHVQDITPRTIPEDFARNPKIHHTYLLNPGS